MRFKHTNIETGKEDAFGTTLNKGYFMNINGYRISVQFGYGNYVDSDVRYGRQPKVEQHAEDEDCTLYGIEQRFNVWQSNLAEVMIDINDPQMALEHNAEGCIKNGHDSVFGWCTTECVAKFMGCIVNAQPGDDITAAINQIYNSNLSRGLS